MSGSMLQDDVPRLVNLRVELCIVVAEREGWGGVGTALSRVNGTPCLHPSSSAHACSIFQCAARSLNAGHPTS